MVERIISCFERRYCGVYSDNTKGVVNVEADSGDRILFDICRVLNCNVWPEIKEDSNLEEDFSVQIRSIKNIFERYSAMSIFENFTVNDIGDGFIDITNYAARYFTISKINPIEFWGKIMSLNKEKESWKGCFLILEICLCCAPFSNATLERLFSHMNIVKSNIRSRLSNDSLNSTLRIRLNGISLGKFPTSIPAPFVAVGCSSPLAHSDKRQKALGSRLASFMKNFVPNLLIIGIVPRTVELTREKENCISKEKAVKKKELSSL